MLQRKNKKMKFKKGFTLIELLVVISIISFLSSVVMTTLNSARDKGTDAAIKTSLTNMRAQGGIYFSTAGNYTGFCSDETINKALVFAASSTKVAIQKNATGGVGFVTCNITTNGWAIQAPLKTDPNKFFCVDQTTASVVASNALANSSDVVCGVAVAGGGTSKILVIGGGGGGGEGGTYNSGGGGGGGYRYNPSYPLSAGTYLVTVGASAPPLTYGNQGNPSVFDTITANGGGYGGWGNVGLPGGSGGGGSTGYTGGLGNQGYAGGTADYDSAGGGGGAGEIGGMAGALGAYRGGKGGDGISNNITGTPVYYAGGGGGGTHLIGGATSPGGSGGGGTGAWYGMVFATSGINGLGGGGGGGSSDGVTGGAGGSGVVIISYPVGSFTFVGYTGTLGVDYDTSTINGGLDTLIIMKKTGTLILSN